MAEGGRTNLIARVVAVNIACCDCETIPFGMLSKNFLVVHQLAFDL